MKMMNKLEKEKSNMCNEKYNIEMRWVEQ